MVDNLIKQMEQYTKNLEGIVEQRTSALRAQQQRMDELLSQLLPKYEHIIVFLMPTYVFLTIIGVLHTSLWKVAL